MQPDVESRLPPRLLESTVDPRPRQLCHLHHRVCSAAEPLRSEDLLSSVAALEITESEEATGELRLFFLLVSRNHVPGAESD
jgi:hypothetical protein